MNAATTTTASTSERTVDAARAAEHYEKFAADETRWIAEADSRRDKAKTQAQKHHATHMQMAAEADRAARDAHSKCVRIAALVRDAQASGRLSGDEDTIKRIVKLTSKHTEGEIAMSKTAKSTKKSAPGSTARATRSTVNDTALKSRVGETLTREYKGKTISVRITEKGFVCDGETYVSLNQIACKAQGRTGRSGDIFFHVGKYARKPKAEKTAKAPKTKKSVSKPKTASKSKAKKTAKGKSAKK